MIKRAIVKDFRLLFRLFPAVGITGPRQVGKTTFAKYIKEQIRRKCIYLDLERDSDALKLQDPESFLIYNSDKCIIIDEVQRIPELFTLLRAIIDMKRTNGRFILLRSASPKILKGVSESLAGRIGYLELTPFNLTEILNTYSFKRHWIRGGFPLPLLARNDYEADTILENFITTYVERDFPQLGLNVSSSLIRRFWTMIAHYHGGIWNSNSFARALGVSHTTVNKYLDFLEGAFIVHKLYPFYLNIKKRLVKSPKIYVRDSGILHHLNRVTNFNDLQNSVLIGASWEGYVIEQVKQVINRNYFLHYYRTHDGTECDLIIAKGLKPISSIEIKYTSAPAITKGFSIAMQDLKTRNNFIITPYSDDYIAGKDVRVCNLETFLTKYLQRI